jgi:tetratricopeptide (TPR) repeat protein
MLPPDAPPRPVMSDPDRWRKVEEVFYEALDHPESQRKGWLDLACGGDAALRGEVESLLASDRVAAGVLVGSSVERAVVQLGLDNLSAVEGRRFGPYRLIRELGRGGMGAVYLAARDDQQYESEVAIKVVRPGLDTDFILRRFRRERQILARLQHPNIARLLDGGTSDDGTPYIVMEYIQGSWITSYADQENLSVEDRLRLFLPVCAAVEHAHRNFIVHRDLKPGNILIDQSGAPKLLDFGVSKLLRSDQIDSAETQGVGMMTPDYASPEQILGEPVTVVSDVYSLGAVLYQLLSRTRPHRIDQCTPLALERAICLDETLAPSAAVRSNGTLSRRLAGDLDNIILRAMQKEPERRYASVEQFAEDIRRHLDHRPVVARPDSLAYRTGKFIRRNLVAVAMGTLFSVSLIGTAAVAIREARIARERFQDVRKLATTFVFDVEQAARNLPGSMPVRQLLARTGLEYLRNLSRNSAGDWTLRRELATAYVRIGELQGGPGNSNLGDPSGALESFRQAQVLLNEVLQRSPNDREAARDRMTLAHRVSNVHRQMGQSERAGSASEEGLRTAEALLAVAPDDAEVVQYAAVFHMDLARLRQQSGDLPAAAKDMESAIRLLRQLSTARPGERETRSNIAASHARLGSIQADLGRRQEALDSFRAGVSELEAQVMRFPNNTYSRHELMLAYSHVGDILGNPAYDNFGDEPGARGAYTKMVEIARTLHETESGDVRAISDYGIALLRLGIVTPPQERRATLHQAQDLLERAAERNPKDRVTAAHKAWAEIELGDAFLAAGDRSTAAGYYRNAAASAETAQLLDPADSSSQRWIVLAARKLAQEQARSGDRAGALSALDKALQLARRVETDAPATSVPRRATLARAWQAAGAVYGTLSNRERGERQNQDRLSSKAWYERSMAEWRRLATLPGFVAARRREMESTAMELQALGRRTEGR